MKKDKTNPQSPEEMAIAGPGSRNKGSYGTGSFHVRKYSRIPDA